MTEQEWPLADPKTELAKTLGEWLPGGAALEAATALVDVEGWRPPLPEGDVSTLISVVGALIDEVAFSDDNAGLSRTIAKALLDAGYLDKTGAVGPPEPVATTLRRIIQDLENEAVFRDPVRVIGAYEERSVDDIVGARTLREYADRLRSHPVLSGESGKDPLPADETEGETHWGREEGGGESVHDGANPDDCYLCRTAELADELSRVQAVADRAKAKVDAVHEVVESWPGDSEIGAALLRNVRTALAGVEVKQS
jgi:hypothetical protein